MSDVGTNDLVGLLRHYGPIAASDAMYDELIQAELDHFGVNPAIVIPPARLNDLLTNFRDAEPVSVILTGTAGDGKTFHCRRVWEELGGARKEWGRGDKRATLRLPSGRDLVVVKDLSELTRPEKIQLLPEVTEALLGQNSSAVFLIAANDGQLLATWRDWAETADPHASRVFSRLEMMLVDSWEDDPAGELRLKLYNLSRLDPSTAFEGLLEQVVEHRMWAECEGCPLLEVEGTTTCPIRINRERLRGPVAGNPFRRRLTEVLSLAAANRLHLPIRHLLLLIANILLGDRKPPTYLLTCRTAKNRARQSDYGVTNPYAHVFGSNLPESHRRQYQAFTVLDSFGIGRETDNGFDNLLIYGGYSDRERYGRLVAADAHYGAPVYQRLLHDYLEGERTQIREFMRALEHQRQRLFFSLSEEDSDLDPWRLSVYRSGGTFLALRDDLMNERPVGRVVETLVCGLNRTFCGMMIDDTAAVYLASSGGDGRGTISTILNHELAVRPKRRDVYLSFHVPPGSPVLEIVVHDPAADTEQDVVARLDLQLTHFEYLMRVAHGSLPVSFSQQCYEDFLDFKLMLIDHMDTLFGTPDPDGPDVGFRAITVDAGGRPQVEEFRLRVDP